MIVEELFRAWHTRLYELNTAACRTISRTILMTNLGHALRKAIGVQILLLVKTTALLFLFFATRFLRKTEGCTACSKEQLQAGLRRTLVNNVVAEILTARPSA